MSAPRIVFMGTPPFAVSSLEALHNAGIPIAAVVTAPDRPAGRGRQVRASAVKEAAIRLGLPVLQPERLRDEGFLEALRACGADLFVVVAFRMLPEVVWRMPRLGTVNLHASLLPRYRGAAPINWAVMHGERSTGLTTFLIQQAIDTGDVLLQEPVPIGPDETAGELHDRMATIGSDLLVRTVRVLATGALAARRQETLIEGGPLYDAPKLTPSNCRINWSWPASKVHDHVRGLSPVPGAWTELVRADGVTEHFKVLRSERTGMGGQGVPGSVNDADAGLLVVCGEGVLRLLEVQPEGRRRMPAAAFRAGLRGSIHFK
ncbi:MAG TPA: methionyl-tRNA formyltransferase [Flavobacteriales bacterium]|nr:methionyl-tRNA formyltransferase [Flavobacteriales bacterium]HMR25939.1 methionyl-tRNA formyltransferase [Flavobacteriales bacterium]